MIKRKINCTKNMYILLLDYQNGCQAVIQKHLGCHFKKHHQRCSATIDSWIKYVERCFWQPFDRSNCEYFLRWNYVAGININLGTFCFFNQNYNHYVDHSCVISSAPETHSFNVEIPVCVHKNALNYQNAFFNTKNKCCFILTDLDAWKS